MTDKNKWSGVFAFGSRASDIEPSSIEQDLDSLEQMFSQPVFRSIKDGPYFIPAKVAGTRNAENVKHYCGLVIDDDSGNHTIEELLSTLPVAAIAHTSWSWKFTKPKHRVFIPYSQNLAPANQPKVAKYFNSLFGDLDHCNEKTLQFFYGPSFPEGSEEDYEWQTTLQTKPICNPVDYIDKLNVGNVSTAPVGVVTNIDQSSVVSTIEPTSAKIYGEGGRYERLFAMSCAMVESGSSLPVVMDALQGVNISRCDPPHTEGRLAEIAKMAFERINNKRTSGDDKPTRQYMTPNSASVLSTPALFANTLPKEGLLQLVSPEGVGKTYVMLDIALRVCTGQDWINKRFVGDSGKPVVMFPGEGISTIPPRIQAWASHYNEGVMPDNFIISDSPTNLTSDEDVDTILSELHQVSANMLGGEAPAMIIFDTLNRNFGAGDENSTEDMKRAVDNLDQIARTFGCLVVVVHHTGHGQSDRGRGSSVLPGACDAIITLSGGVAGVIELNITKVKAYQRPMAPITLNLTTIDFGKDEYGDRQTQAYIRYNKNVAPQIIDLVNREHFFTSNGLNPTSDRSEIGRQLLTILLERATEVLRNNRPIDQIIYKRGEFYESMERRGLRRNKSRAWEMCRERGWVQAVDGEGTEDMEFSHITIAVPQGMERVINQLEQFDITEGES